MMTRRCHLLGAGCTDVEKLSAACTALSTRRGSNGSVIFLPPCLSTGGGGCVLLRKLSSVSTPGMLYVCMTLYV